MFNDFESSGSCNIVSKYDNYLQFNLLAEKNIVDYNFEP